MSQSTSQPESQSNSQPKSQSTKAIWFDIPVTDFEKSKEFYSKIFSWDFLPMGDDYNLIQVGKEHIGGLRLQDSCARDGNTPVLYFSVKDLDRSAQQIEKNGGKILGEKVVISSSESNPTDTPEDDHGGGAFYLFNDIDSNMLAIWADA